MLLLKYSFTEVTYAKILPHENFPNFLPNDKVLTKQIEMCVSLSEVSKTLGFIKKSMSLN